MNIALLGYGKMGKTIEKLALEKGDTIVAIVTSSKDLSKLKGADVAIDFSVPDAAVTNITACFEQGIPVVSGTTGWLDHYDKVLNLCQSRNGSFIYASNFSIGVNLFFELNKKLAKMMAKYGNYNVSIEEIHHIQKLDAPSGTAISLAKDIIEQTKYTNWKLDSASENEIAIKALREEEVKGTHTVSYTSPIDTISIKHEAHNREGFAMGALLAAAWLKDKKGIYSMKDVLSL
ncbi:MAG: 4-hydroxy-tetrahydrodipicolinate reductase [Flavobacteriaceae bacterium]|nr:4-hydroxy-tetrahydrodipicolinate reductase [Flavobacteriaceae bacterium]